LGDVAVGVAIVFTYVCWWVCGIPVGAEPAWVTCRRTMER